jgi:excisionase family DNA binding protein
MSSPTLDELRTWIFATVPEIAAVTRNDPRTVRRAIEEGQIPACRFGDTVRIPVAKFLELCGLAPETNEASPASAAGERFTLIKSVAARDLDSGDHSSGHPAA